MKHWTNEEIEKLISMNNKGYSIIEISHLLDRSENSVIKKLWKMGKSYSGRKLWTKDEENYILENAGKISFRYICKKLNRSPEALYAKLHKLGVTSIKDNNGYFTLNQLSILSHKSYKYLEKKIEDYKLSADKKSITNNKKRIYMIKGENFWEYAFLHKKDFRFSLIEKNSIPVEPEWVDLERKKETDIYTYKSWNNEQISNLKQLFNDGCSYAEIARRTGRTKNSVMCKLQELRLKRQVQLRYSKKEIELIFDMLREGKHLKDIAEGIGRDYYLLSRKIREFKKNGKYKIYIRPQKYSIMTDNKEIDDLLNIINK